MAENTNVRFNIPTADLKALKELAKQRGVTLTSIVHEAVGDYISQHTAHTSEVHMRHASK
jgi:hypothetical protein